jgi:hypothetical protein
MEGRRRQFKELAGTAFGSGGKKDTGRTEPCKEGTDKERVQYFFCSCELEDRVPKYIFHGVDTCLYPFLLAGQCSVFWSLITE